MGPGFSKRELTEILQRSRSRGDFSKIVEEWTGVKYVPTKVSRIQRFKDKWIWRGIRIRRAFQVLHRGYHDDEERDW